MGTGRRLRVQALPLPYHHELRQGMPETPQPGEAIPEIKRTLVERPV
jgi:hypothetical protein